jgi:hypothetical protein
MTSFHPVEDSSRDFAALYLVGRLVPALLFDPASAPITLDAPLWVAAGVLGLGSLVDLWRGIELLASGTSQGLRGLGRRSRLPGRGLALWALDLIWREPLTDPAQARESLANLCGYRLHGEGYRVVSIIPSVHRWRIGVWVSLARPSSFTKRWECRYIRWVDDPHELRLLRSALRGGETPPSARPSTHAIPLDEFNGDEVDELLGGPASRPIADHAPPGKSRK